LISRSPFGGKGSHSTSAAIECNPHRKGMLQKFGTAFVLHCRSQEKFARKQYSLVLLLVKLIASSSHLLRNAFRDVRVWKCCVTFRYYDCFKTNMQCK